MGTERVDVLQVITSTAARGAEQFAMALAPELRDRGLTVDTVALVRGRPHTLDAEVLGRGRLRPATIRRLRARAKKAEVVVAHGSTTLPASFLATRATRTPFVYRNIGDPAYWATSPRRRIQSRILLGRARAIVALTWATALRLEEYYSVDPDRVVVIPRGVSAETFPRRDEERYHEARHALGLSPDSRLALCVGALSEEKNVANAVRALAILPDRWQLMIAGEGPDRPMIQQVINQAAPGRVAMLGARTDVPDLMAAADVLLLPSKTEGLPGVVIEAAMVGVPAVATRVGFVEEIIVDGVNGRLVPSNDAAAMAEAILASEDRLVEMGRAAHLRASEGFSLASTAERWSRLLAGLLPPDRQPITAPAGSIPADEQP